jgi:hypothetical protein
MVQANNTVEEIVLANNAIQLIGSSNGNTTTARRITFESKAVQCLGDFTDSTLQQIINGYSYREVRSLAGRPIQNVPQSITRNRHN